MKFVFLMDPLDTVDVHKDTSFVFMLGAARRGHEVYHVANGAISLDGPRVVFNATRVTPVLREDALPFDVGEIVRLAGDEIDAVFVRNDPPFDQRYLMNTWLLDRLPAHVAVVNSPRGLRTVNEKLWATRFTDLIPPTLVTAERDLIAAFLDDYERIVLKPTDGHGGAGVFIVNRGDTNAGVIVETLTQNGTTEIIAQPFVPEADAGDKRIILIDGNPVGAVLRVHSGSDHRNNFFAGGKPQPAELTQRDREICDTLAPHLRELGLHFVGVDVIGDYLIEVNVTSPTGVQEINRLNNTHLENQLIEYVENLVTKNRTTSPV